MADLDKIRAKLRALRAKTVENGCTEEEAVAAAEKMAELLSKHDLTEEDLQAADYRQHEVPLGRRGPLDPVWFAVATFADCRGWYVRRGRQVTFCFFGRPQDTLVAEYVYDVMKGHCAGALADFRKSPLYLRRRTSKTRADAVRAFQEGLAEPLIRKLLDGLYRRHAPGSPSIGRQLVRAVQGQLEVMMGRHGVKLGNSRPIKEADGRFKEDAQRQGQQAGAAVDVHAGVGTAPSKVAGLLQ